MTIGIIAGVRTIGQTDGNAALYDTVSGWAFGPTFADGAEAQSFIEACPQDPRSYIDKELQSIHEQWCTWLAEQDYPIPTPPKFEPKGVLHVVPD